MLTIRLADKTDAEKILAIYSPYITDTDITFETEVPSLEEFTVRVESISNEYPYIVCEVDGEIVGYAYASKHSVRSAYRYSVDTSIYIAHNYHSQGIGKALYTRLFELLENKEVYTAYALITLPNDRSVGIHKLFGFHEVGVYHNVGYKHNNWLDVICLEKPLKMYGTPKV